MNSTVYIRGAGPNQLMSLDVRGRGSLGVMLKRILPEDTMYGWQCSNKSVWNYMSEGECECTCVCVVCVSE